MEVRVLQHTSRWLFRVRDDLTFLRHILLYSSFGQAPNQIQAVCDTEFCVTSSTLRRLPPNVDNFVYLCAGVNSFVTRAIKKMMTSTKEQGKDTTLFVVGEKGRSQLSRIHADVSFCIVLYKSIALR